MNKLSSFLMFYQKAEKLKTTTRHSWLSDPKRQESSAEHSWMLGLMALVLAPELSKKVNAEKVLKMVIVHDLAEAVTGDIPSFEVSERQRTKHASEEKALAYVVSDLPQKVGKEIKALWEEFEASTTFDAKFANALDKIEAVIQHNLAGTNTWDEGDYRIQPYYNDHYFDFDTFVRSLKNYVDIETMEKILGAKQEKLIDPKYVERYKKESQKKLHQK